jgi:hypothetical protein
VTISKVAISEQAKRWAVDDAAIKERVWQESVTDPVVVKDACEE